MHRFAFVAFVLLAAAPLLRAADRPNVIVILTDDQGWGDLSLHDNPNLSTPNIDSLARDGAELRNFYVCAVCSPTRAEFLTGRYHARTGVYSTSAGGERFNADEQTIGDVFQAAGYATAAYGKWHSGMQYPYHPNARGFEDYYGFCSGHWGHYFSPMLEHNNQIVKGNGFLVDDLVDHAIDFISQHQRDPFFVYLPLNTPHSPMQVPDKFWDKFKDKQIVPDPTPANAKKQNLVHTRAALAMCENIDENVGRLLKHLETKKLQDNTIVVYFSDNGPNGSRFNAGMRGRKGSTHEGGLRSPCVIRYPDKIPRGLSIEGISGAIDLLPTLAEFAGIEYKPKKTLDGMSMAKVLSGKSDPGPREIFSNWNGKTTVRTQQYRLQGTGELYDIKNDPKELVNVADKRPKVLKELKAKLNAWIADAKPVRSRNEGTKRPFTLAHPDATLTQMPARDAVGSGQIKRSNRFPNCSFLGNWKSTDDHVTWEVDVLSDGMHAVQLLYACKPESVGSRLALTIGNETVEAEITEANPSPLVGAAEDRFERAESYVRNWKAMDLGKIKLTKGPAMIRLSATKINGDELCDVRLLLFRRL